MNSLSFEFIQSSQIKIHNKPISKTPFFFSQLKPPNYHFQQKHYITTITKFSKIPRTLISKKLQNLNQTTTSQASRSRSVQTTTTTQIHNTTITSRTTKLADPSIIGGPKRVKKNQRFVNKRGFTRSRFKIFFGFSRNKHPSSPPPLIRLGSVKRERNLRERERVWKKNSEKQIGPTYIRVWADVDESGSLVPRHFHFFNIIIMIIFSNWKFWTIVVWSRRRFVLLEGRRAICTSMTVCFFYQKKRDCMLFYFIYIYIYK